MKKGQPTRLTFFLWSQQGMILRPPDYESGATNQLSYGTKLVKELKFARGSEWLPNHSTNIILFSIS